jgi:hypothetical protein
LRSTIAAAHLPPTTTRLAVIETAPLLGPASTSSTSAVSATSGRVRRIGRSYL